MYYIMINILYMILTRPACSSARSGQHIRHLPDLDAAARRPPQYPWRTQPNHDDTRALVLTEKALSRSWIGK